ncbi:4Fe-4S dicluster domain-containing protein [candidate division WOR-3 bacterium]|nr:4Fe-4S dicluster domain-containing protein [candidate division WOR-3 bacterium]
MKRTKRKIIHIDEDLCDGCGNCIPACHEQALQIVETPRGPKAWLVKEFYCDGLGACLGNCPKNALSLVEQEAEPYDEEATTTHIKDVLARHIEHQQGNKDGSPELPVEPESKCAGTCPGAAVAHWEKSEEHTGQRIKLASELRQWPVQIHLVPVSAPFLQNADIAVIADCVPFAYANLHQDFLKGKAVLVGCPKLDDTGVYVDKIARIIDEARPKSITIVRMEVPCCSGLTRIIQEAKKRAGRDIPLKEIVIGIKGELLDAVNPTVPEQDND